MNTGSRAETALPQLLYSMRAWPLGIGLCALVGCGIGIWADAQRMLAAYLAAWLYFLGLSLGALAALMMHHLTGGDWGRPVRRYFEAMLAPLPALAVLFLPLALGLPRPFFQLRAVALFAVWLLFAWLLAQAGRNQRRIIGISAVGLIVYLASATLAAIDWIASLTPHWTSTGLGLIVVTGQCLGALSFAIAAAAGLSLARAPTSLQPWHVTPARGNDLGNLLLTFVMTWMYLSFAQLLIIWAEDLPRETAWYRPRLSGDGLYLALAVTVAQFAIPFALLLFRRVKRDVRMLFALSCWLVLAHLLDVVWLVMPSLWKSGSVLAAAGRVILATLATGGIWLFLVTRDLSQRPTFAHAALDAHEESPEPEMRSHG